MIIREDFETIQTRTLSMVVSRKMDSFSKINLSQSLFTDILEYIDDGKGLSPT